MKMTNYFAAVVFSCIAMMSANAEDARLEKILKQYPQEMVNAFYDSGMYKAENYDAAKLLSIKNETETPKEFFISPIPECDNQNGNECGGMSSAFVMRFYGEQVSGLEIYGQIKEKNINGTISPKPLKNYWDEKSEYKMNVFRGNLDDLKDAVSHNIPVIVLINCPGGWHYVPVVGYDRKNLYLQDSVPDFRNVKNKQYNRKIPCRKFEKYWDVVLPESDHLMFIAEKIQ